MSKKVVITGGAGFVGSHLADRLIQENYEVILFDNFAAGAKENLEGIAGSSKLKLVEGDIRDKDTLAKILTPDVETVYHLCAVVGVQDYCDDPLRVIDVNVLGTRTVLELAQKNDIRVLFTSTSEVFGKNPDVPWSEYGDRVVGSTSIDRWTYSTSKALCEHIAFGMHRTAGLKMSIVRFFNAYGPRQRPTFVVSQSVQRALRGEKPYLYDSGKQTRCFTFIEDAIEGMLRASRRKEAIGKAFNIGNNKESTMAEVVEEVLKATGHQDLGFERVDTAKRYGNRYEDIPRRIPGVSEAKRILDWEATTPLSEGIRRTVSWAREQDWWLSWKC